MQSKEINADVRRGFGRRKYVGLHLQNYGNLKELGCTIDKAAIITVVVMQ